MTATRSTDALGTITLANGTVVEARRNGPAERANGVPNLDVQFVDAKGRFRSATLKAARTFKPNGESK